MAGARFQESDMAKRSKRFEVLDQRPVNKDGYINEWPEMGFVAMHSPYDPKPSIRIENGKIVELDGKQASEYDFLDQFIADYAINKEQAPVSMAMSNVEIARKIVDIDTPRKEVLKIISGITPAKMVEVINELNVVELMMGMQKIRARKRPGNQAHITNLKDDPVQIAADADGRGKVCASGCDGASDRFPGRPPGRADAVLVRGSDGA